MYGNFYTDEDMGEWSWKEREDGTIIVEKIDDESCKPWQKME